MKLKHLFLTALVVGAFASCSDDGNGPSEPVYQQIDTYLSITAISNNGLLSKAGTVEDEGTDDGSQLLTNENYINTLTAYVFYTEGGKLAAKQTVSATDKSIDRIEDIIVKVDATEAGQISKTSLTLVLLANVTLDNDPTTLADLKGMAFTGIDALSVDKVKGGEAYLPMSSSEIKIPANKLVAGTQYDNWITLKMSGAEVTNTTNVAENEDEQPVLLPNSQGSVVGVDSNSSLIVSEISEGDKIALTRYVARIQLEGLDCKFAGNYEDATFTLKTVSIINASNSSKLFGEGAFGLQDVIGDNGVKGVYNQTSAFYRGYPVDIIRADYYLAEGTQNDVLKKEYTEGILLSNEKNVLFKGAENAEKEAPEMACFYVFEFQKFAIGQDTHSEEGDILGAEGTKDIYTTLLLTGEWNNGTIEGTRNFRIPVKSTTGIDGEGVMRNTVYKVSATLTGEGTDNPDKNMLNACLSFSIKVLPWHVIKQEEDDVN